MLRDLRYAARMLIKTPGFTIIAILALALGIGASTTMFSAVNALLLRPMPLIQDQERLVYISEYFSKSPDHDAGVAFPDFLDWKKEVTTLEGLGAITEATFILSGGEKPDRYLGGQISAETFSFLGVQPILGRQFRPEEDKVNAAPVALIGYEVWQKHFARDPAVVGKIIPINGKQTTIIGVMPKGWRFPEVCDIWIPLQLERKIIRAQITFSTASGNLSRAFRSRRLALNSRPSMHAWPSIILIPTQEKALMCSPSVKKA